MPTIQLKLRVYKLWFVALLFSLFSVNTFAGGESGFYVGGGLGIWDVTVDFDDIDEDDLPDSDNLDGDANTYKLIGGYNFGVIPLIDLGVEASYNVFDTAEDGDFSTEMDSLNAFGLASLTFGPFGIFGKAGLASYNIDYLIDDKKITDGSGEDPVYGLGVRFQIAGFSVRAEYEHYDLESYLDIGVTTASLLYTF